MNQIEKKTYINILLDIYGELLTKKQKNVMEMYYRYDLSLSEIAENEKISRAAVSDLIKRVEVILDEYESKLCLYKKHSQIKDIIENLDEETKRKILELL